MKVKKEIIVTNNSEETRELGKKFAKSLKAGDIVCLYGDLGAGKTTFAQGLAEGLEIKKRIISPTFVIVRCYELQNQESKIKNQNYNSKFKSLGSKTFYHIDLYRTESEKDIEGLGIEEIINSRDNIVAIEWAEKVGGLLPEKRIDVGFEYASESKRKISIQNTQKDSAKPDKSEVQTI